MSSSNKNGRIPGIIGLGSKRSLTSQEILEIIKDDLDLQQIIFTNNMDVKNLIDKKSRNNLEKLYKKYLKNYNTKKQNLNFDNSDDSDFNEMFNIIKLHSNKNKQRLSLEAYCACSANKEEYIKKIKLIKDLILKKIFGKKIKNSEIDFEADSKTASEIVSKIDSKKNIIKKQNSLRIVQSILQGIDNNYVSSSSITQEVINSKSYTAKSNEHELERNYNNDNINSDLTHRNNFEKKSDISHDDVFNVVDHIYGVGIAESKLYENGGYLSQCEFGEGFESTTFYGEDGSSDTINIIFNFNNGLDIEVIDNGDQTWTIIADESEAELSANQDALLRENKLIFKKNADGYLRMQDGATLDFFNIQYVSW